MAVPYMTNIIISTEYQAWNLRIESWLNGGHNAFITGVDGPGTYQDVVTGDATKGFTITNTHTPETVTLKGTKTWVGTELDSEAPTELKVHLYANGTEVTAQAKTVTAADDWKWMRSRS